MVLVHAHRNLIILKPSIHQIKETKMGTSPCRRPARRRYANFVSSLVDFPVHLGQESRHHRTELLFVASLPLRRGGPTGRSTDSSFTECTLGGRQNLH
jgi:hypothetical protein